MPKRKAPANNIGLGGNDNESDSDDAPLTMSMSTARELTKTQKRAEELGRKGINDKNRERHRAKCEQDDLVSAVCAAAAGP